MDILQAYKIGFAGLSNGDHQFSFDIDQSFFEGFDESEIDVCAVHLDLKMEKDTNMLVFDFTFSGWAELGCDRCLDIYQETVDQKERLIVKLGESYQEQSEDVIIIPSGDSHFDISHYIYEFLHLGLPIRRTHGLDEHGVSACNQEMLDKVKQYAKARRESLSEEMTDAQKEALNALRFKNNDN